MNKKLIISWLQNLLLILLTASALYLLSLIPGGSWTNRFQAFLTSRPQTVSQTQEANLRAAIPALHVMVTSDPEYGRFGSINMSAQDQQVQQLTPLLQDALGSAVEIGPTDDAALHRALQTPGFLLDLTTELPLSVISTWLEAELSLECPVRRIALTTEDSTNAALYLQAEDGTILRYGTALSVSAVQELAGTFAPNGSRFAYESNYPTLAPYTFLITETPALPQITAAVPAGFSADTLLSALGFNVHNRYRYTESSGTEVIIESPRELRIDPNGMVSYTGDDTVTASLYRISTAGDRPTAAEAVQGAVHLASALTAGTGASPLSLQCTEVTESGYTVFFRYHHSNYPVFASYSGSIPSDGYALSVTVTGSVITSFTYHCRAYTSTGSASLLLPSAQAIAVASIYPGAELMIGYTDHGQSTLAADWQAG